MGLLFRMLGLTTLVNSLTKYIFMKLDFINIWWITEKIKLGTQRLRCSNLQSGSLH